MMSYLMKTVLLVSVLCFSQLASANGLQTARQYIPNAQAVGKIRLSYLFWNVYDATLYAPAGRWAQGQPMALSLDYLMSLKGRDIAARSIEEMRKQGFNDEATLGRWYQQMLAIFPNVNKNTRITGIRDQRGHTLFYRNGQRIGTIADPRFSQQFFNIWVGERTSEPRLRSQLLGL